MLLAYSQTEGHRRRTRHPVFNFVRVAVHLPSCVHPRLHPRTLHCNGPEAPQSLTKPGDDPVKMSNDDGGLSGTGSVSNFRKPSSEKRRPVGCAVGTKP
jgi:hypothetical protein